MGWGLLYYALASVVMSYAVAMLTAKNTNQKPTAGQLDVPTAEEGGCIPVCFGTNLVKQSNVVWYGDPGVTKIKSKGGKK